MRAARTVQVAVPARHEAMVARVVGEVSSVLCLVVSSGSTSVLLGVLRLGLRQVLLVHSSPRGSFTL